MAVMAPPERTDRLVEHGASPLEALIEEARRRQRRRRRLSAFVLILASVVAVGTYLVGYRHHSSNVHGAHPPAVGAVANPSPIRVTLTAKNHYPRASDSPSVQWGYCVKVRTTAGTAPSSRTHVLLEIVKGQTPLVRVGEVLLNRGYDNWCADIGGEANTLLAVPRRQDLNFEAVVTAMGATVRRSWPIVVR